MMGSQGGSQEQLFYSFSLDDHVPKDHLLRGIDCFLDLSELRGQLAPFYSHTGRPSVDPVLMMRMLVIGYSFGIRSERRLCEEVHLNLAYRWFCRLGLDEPVPCWRGWLAARALRSTPSGRLKAWHGLYAPRRPQHAGEFFNTIGQDQPFARTGAQSPPCS
jgi:hypothetical protein